MRVYILKASGSAKSKREFCSSATGKSTLSEVGLVPVRSKESKNLSNLDLVICGNIMSSTDGRQKSQYF